MSRYKIQVDVKLSLITCEGKPHEEVKDFIGTANIDLPSSLSDAHDELLAMSLLKGALVQATVDKQLFLAEEEEQNKQKK